MNLNVITRAVEAYKDGACESDAARLDFFKGLYEIQQARADAVAQDMEYEPVPREEADEAYVAFEPLLPKAPIAIDEVQFFGTCKQVADYLVENAGLEDEAARALGALDWYKFVGKLDLELAGSQPATFVEECLKDFDSFGLGSDVSASLVMMVVSFALRAHLQPAAERLFAAVSKDVSGSNQIKRPLVCPVCGSPATASHVAASRGIDGRDREQYCSMCGTTWAFERMRCGVCGTENAARLHYFHLDEDSSHRIQNCDECGQYQRVFFEEDL